MNARSLLCLLVLVLGSVTGCEHPRALYEDPPRSALEEGRLAEQRRQYQDADQHYQRIDEASVRNMAVNHLASAWENVNANLIHSQEMVTQRPDSATAHLTVAQDYYNKALLCSRYSRETVGDYPRDFVKGQEEYYYNQALEHAQRAGQLEGDMPEAALLIGEIYLAVRMNDKAVETLRRLVNKHPEYARGYYALGKVYFDLENYTLCERYFIRAIKLDPMLYDAYYLLGQFFFEEKLYDYAAHTFLEILRNLPQDVPAFEMLAESSHELGKQYLEEERYAEAIRLFQEVLKAKSSYKVHQSLLFAQTKQKEAELLKQQQADLQQVAPEEAPEISEFKALLFADQKLEILLPKLSFPDDPDWDAVLTHFQEEDFQAGYDLLQVAPEKNRTNPYRSLAVAYALIKLERTEDALYQLRQMTTSRDVESRAQLAAWLTLRGLGEELDPAILYRVLGVMIEVVVPEQNGVDMLVAYLDGRVRYITTKDNILVWDRTDGEISDLARNLVYTSQAIARDFPPEQQRSPLTTNNVRVTLLTGGGVRVFEDNETRVRQQTSMISPVFKVGTDLLETLLHIARKT